MPKTRKKKNLFREFFESEKIGGMLLLGATFLSLLLANFFIGKEYSEFWHHTIQDISYEHIVNDGLMTIFFLLVGLELKREVFIGELSDVKKSMLPIIAAVGGMLAPALIHYFFNAGTNTQSGAGIPTATDIAFSIAVLSLFGNKVPNSLKIFLTALAIADDLGAVLVIALFYTKTISWYYLIAALAVFGLLLLFNKFKVKALSYYLIAGSVMWFFMSKSGIHATISGVMLAFAIPFTNAKTGSAKLQHRLHKPVALYILPLFALVNTSIYIHENWMESLFSSNSYGVFYGLVLGKPLGIIVFTFIALSLKICKLPKGVHWNHITGASILAGIGFTMSIFVSGLAFDNTTLIQFSQIVVLISSLTASLLGMIWFRFMVK